MEQVAPGESAQRELRVRITSDADILSARGQARARVLELGFPTTEMVRIVTAVSELARNMLLYAGRGELSLSTISSNGRIGILIVARDEGPGIPDVEKALLDGFSTSGGLGLGLPGTRRLMDEFTIQSEPNKGTVVTVKKWLEDGMMHPEPPRKTAAVEIGAASRALQGQAETGDRYVVCHTPGGVLFAAIDGLGHGPEAAYAAQLAADAVKSSASTDVIGLVQECHRQLQGSRGVVMTIVALDPSGGKATWIGIGNVQGMLVRGEAAQKAGSREFAVLRSGIVGQRLPTLQPSVTEIRSGDTFVLATDGVALDFMRERALGQRPQLLAERLLERHGLKNDDALVLVVRFAGEENDDSADRRGARI